MVEIPTKTVLMEEIFNISTVHNQKFVNRRCVVTVSTAIRSTRLVGAHLRKFTHPEPKISKDEWT